MARGVTRRCEARKLIGAADGGHFAPRFSEIEYLVAIDVIRSAIAEHRKHLDPEVLRSVLTKLTAACEQRKGTAPASTGPHSRSGIADDPAETP